MSIPKPLQMAIGLLVVVAAVWAFWYLPSQQQTDDLAAQAMVEVALPDRFSARERQGKTLYDEKCATCHGANAAGSAKGPPLVHRLYQSGHHSDASFILASERGVRAHHWQFGDMEALEGVSRGESGVIVSYVRALQQANGIR